MECTASKLEDTLVLTVRGRMDAVTAPEFEKEVIAWLEKGETRMVADLSGLEYISSAGLRSILASGKRLKAAKGGLGFSGLAGMVQEVFSVSGFIGMFPTHATAEEAARAMAARA